MYKRTLFLIPIFLFTMFFSASSVSAASPSKSLGFQGQLFSNGTPLSSSVNATFTFYDAPTAGSVTGSPISKTVTVNNGYFGTSFTGADTAGVNFDQALYVQVNINGTDLSPRTALNAAPTALKSFGTFSYSSAPTVGPAGSLYFNTTDGMLYVSNGTAWVTSGSSWMTNGTSTYTLGNVGIGTTSSDFALNVSGQANFLGGSGTGSVLISNVDLATSTRDIGSNVMIGSKQGTNGGTVASVILGFEAFTSGGSNDYQNVIIGYGASQQADVAIGYPKSVIIGGLAKSIGGTNTVIGNAAQALGGLNIVVGQGSIASSSNNVIVGRTTTVTGTSSGVFGSDNGTISQADAYIYGRGNQGGGGGFTSHGYGTLIPIASARMTIRTMNTGTSSSLALISRRAGIAGNTILGGIDFVSDSTALALNGTTTASIQAIANQTHSASALGTDLSFKVTAGTTTFEALRILGNGNVGIGTTTPTATLTASGTIRFSSLGSGTLSTDSLGNVTVSSDERLKDIQGEFKTGLEKILGINPIVYKWKPETGYDTEHAYAGFSAQNVQSMIPEAVGTDNRGFLTLADRPILATLVNAVKELASKVEGFAENFTSKHIKTEDITTNKLCVEDVCVTKEQLKVMLLNSGQSPDVTLPVVAPSVETITSTSTVEENTSVPTPEPVVIETPTESVPPTTASSE
jgi:hypothetical protein